MWIKLIKYYIRLKRVQTLTIKWCYWTKQNLKILRLFLFFCSGRPPALYVLFSCSDCLILLWLSSSAYHVILLVALRFQLNQIFLILLFQLKNNQFYWCTKILLILHLSQHFNIYLWLFLNPPSTTIKISIISLHKLGFSFQLISNRPASRKFCYAVPLPGDFQ